MSEHPIDPDAPPSEEEIRESQRLREALDNPSVAHEGAELLRAVKSAGAPKALEDSALDRAVASGLAKFDASRRRRGVVVRVMFGAGALAAAAVLLVVIGRQSVAPQPSELAHARSTQSLFTERFEARGGESARIDRIASARAADLRDNHFARWGVRENRGRR